VGVALGHGGRASLLPLAVVVAVEAHQKAILEKKRAFCYWLNTLRHWVRRVFVKKVSWKLKAS